MTYEQPDKSQGFAPSDHPEWLGQLFLIWPERVETVTFTRPDGTQDPTDIVTADVAIITLPDPNKGGQPTFLKSARIGGSALVPQIKNKVGRKVLGSLSQAAKQPGKNAAYYLNVPGPETAEWKKMVQVAEEYEAQFPHTTAQQYGNTAPTAAPAAWQQTPAAPAWGTPQAAVPADTWPEGLREFLTSKGFDTSKLDEATARQIAATLPQD